MRTMFRFCRWGLVFVGILGISGRPTPVQAETIQALSGDSFTRQDGAVARLVNVRAPLEEAPAAAARQALGTTLREATVTDIATDGLDRYGRQRVLHVALTPKASGATTLHEALLKVGAVFLDPETDSPLPESWRQAEREARAAGRGLWQVPAYADQAPDDVGARVGHEAFVRGRVLHVSRVKNIVYMNFGPDWRTDFTIRIPARLLRGLRQQGLDPTTLEGQEVRVRGLVQRSGGPAIELVNAGQLERGTP